MKKLRIILFIAILFSFISCNKSLENRRYSNFNVSETEYSAYGKEWLEVFDPKTEFISVDFIDDYNASFIIYPKDITQFTYDSFNLSYNYDKKEKRGRLRSLKNSMPFRVYKNPERLILSRGDNTFDTGITLYKSF